MCSYTGNDISVHSYHEKTVAEEKRSHPEAIRKQWAQGMSTAMIWKKMLKFISEFFFVCLFCRQRNSVDTKEQETREVERNTKGM